MSLVNPSQSAPGEEINAEDINGPINQIAAVVNGNLDDTNISSMSGSKLADSTVTNAKLATGSGEPGGAWTDFDTTVVGFSSTSVKELRYKQIGKTVFVRVSVQGTSNSATTTFTLPVTPSPDAAYQGAFVTGDSGGNYFGSAFFTGNTPCEVRKGNTSGNPFSSFSSSGAKTFIGNLFYEAA